MRVLLCVFLVVFLSQLQEGLSQQGDNLTLPLTQTTRAIEGNNQTCPPDEYKQFVRDQTKEEVGSTLRDIAPILPTLIEEECDNRNYGRVARCPATSCSDIVERSAALPLSGYYWLEASDRTAVQAYCDTLRRVCNDTAILGLYQFCPAESCDAVNGEGYYWIQTANGTVSQILCCFLGLGESCPATSCSEIQQNDPSATSDYYWMQLANGTTTQVYCEMTPRCACSSATPYTRVAFVNMTDSSQQCPGEFMEVSNSIVRACGRQTTSSGSCNSATFSVLGMEYQHVCGRIVGWQIGVPLAFYGSTQLGQGIDGYYVGGISITYGGPPREHIWSLAGAVSESYTSNANLICPCTNTAISSPDPPSFVGNDFFCETGIDYTFTTGLFYEDSDPLWDGEGCGSTSTCCDFNNPPWFCKQLPQPTTEDIEVRVCQAEATSAEDTPFEHIELYIR